MKTFLARFGARWLRMCAALLTMFAVSGSIQLGAQTVPRGFVQLTMPFSTRSLSRGDTLLESDIEMRDTTVSDRRFGALQDSDRARAGWIARRAIAAGELLRTPSVSPLPAVTGGATVSVIYQDGPVRLVMTGVATNSAPIGAPVSVRIDNTRRLDGVASAPNTVRLK